MPSVKTKTSASPVPPEGHRQRLRERFLARNGRPLEDRYALELLLTYAIPRRDVLPLADALLGQFGSIVQILNASEDELRAVPGIGDATVLLIKLVGRFAGTPAPRQSTKARPPAKADEAAGLFRLPPPAPETTSVSAEAKLNVGQPATTSATPVHDTANKKVSPAPRRPRTGLFGKGLLKDAISCLPKMPDTDSLEEIRSFLRNGGLHYSGVRTRQRFANYIVGRLFPTGSADRALRLFGRNFAECQALRDACLYRFLKAEPFLQQLMLDLFVPAAGAGVLARDSLRRYIASQFPAAKPNAQKSCGQAAAEIVQAAGLGTVTRTRVSVTFRDVCLESFAFLVHSEFPEPGMYAVSEVEHGDIFRAMLWRPDALLPAVYELRNRGWISKVSEIDSVRQFTTRYNLDEVVERIVSEGGRR